MRPDFSEIMDAEYIRQTRMVEAEKMRLIKTARKQINRRRYRKAVVHIVIKVVVGVRAAAALIRKSWRGLGRAEDSPVRTLE